MGEIATEKKKQEFFYDRLNDEGMTGVWRWGRDGRMQLKEEKIIKRRKTKTSNSGIPGLAVTDYGLVFLLFVDNPQRSTLFTHLTAWHRLLHIAFAKNVLAGDFHTEQKVEERSGYCHCWFSIWLAEA